MKLLKPLLASALLALPASPMTVRAEDSDAQKQAIEALRRVQSPRSTAPAAKAPAVKPVDMNRTAPVANPAYVPPSDTAAQQKALEVLRSKPVAKPAAPTLVSKATPAPIPAMAPTTKEGKLAELTRRYLNDEVTPREYHTQRAKILAD